MAGSGNDDSQMELYHHTSKAAVNKILKSRYIKQSSDTNHDATHGIGTYLTSLDEKEPKPKVLENNYDRAIKANADKAEVAIQLLVDKDKVEKISHPTKEIYRYKGDIPTDNIIKIHDRETGKTYKLKKSEK